MVFSGGGVVAECSHGLQKPTRFSGGGGVVAEFSRGLQNSLLNRPLPRAHYRVSAWNHMRDGEIFDAYYSLHGSMSLCAVAVFVEFDMTKEAMSTTSPAEWLILQNRVPDVERYPIRRATNSSRKT